MQWQIKDGSEYVKRPGSDRLHHYLLDIASNFSEMIYMLSADEIDGVKANKHWYAIEIGTGREFTRSQALEIERNN